MCVLICSPGHYFAVNRYALGAPMVGYSPDAVEVGVTTFERKAGDGHTGMCNEHISVDSGNTTVPPSDAPLANAPVLFGVSTLAGCQLGIHKSEFMNCMALSLRAQNTLDKGFGLDSLRCTFFFLLFVFRFVFGVRLPPPLQPPPLPHSTFFLSYIFILMLTISTQ